LSIGRNGHGLHLDGVEQEVQELVRYGIVGSILSSQFRTNLEHHLTGRLDELRLSGGESPHATPCMPPRACHPVHATPCMPPRACDPVHATPCMRTLASPMHVTRCMSSRVRRVSVADARGAFAAIPHV
jgi:hypothetical protein